MPATRDAMLAPFASFRAGGATVERDLGAADVPEHRTGSATAGGEGLDA